MLKKRRRRRKKTKTKTKNKVTKVIKIYIYEVCFKKIRVLFFVCKVIVGYKSEN